MNDKDEIKKDILNYIDKNSQDSEMISEIINEQTPDYIITISKLEDIKGEIFNGLHGSIRYIRGDRMQVLVRYSGEIGPVYKMDDSWGIKLNLNNKTMILKTDDAVRFLKNHFYLTPGQTQKILEVLNYFIQDNINSENYLNYSVSPIKIENGKIKIDHQQLNNATILKNLRNFYPQASHPDYFSEIFSYTLIAPFHNELKHIGKTIIQTPLMLAEGTTKGSKTSIPAFFIGKGFNLAKDNFLYGLERVKTQADLNVHANESNLPMIIDDVKTSWIEKNKESLKSYVQTGVFADRGKQNGIELNELKGQRSIIFTLNDKYRIDTDLAITNRIFIEKFTKVNSSRLNKTAFSQFVKSIPSGFMYSLISELFNNKNIIDIYNEIENLEDPIDWLNYGLKKINILCRKYNIPEFPLLKAKKLQDNDTNSWEIAQAFIGEWERVISGQKSKLEKDFKIEEKNSRIYIYFTASAFKTINSTLALHLPYDSAIDFINNIKSDLSSVYVENNGETVSVRVEQYIKKMYCISIPDSDNANSNLVLYKLLKLRDETEELGLPTDLINKKIDELSQKESPNENPDPPKDPPDNDDRNPENSGPSNDNKGHNNFDITLLPEGPVKQSLKEEQELKEIEKNKDNPDIIYRKSQDLAIDIAFVDTFQYSGFNYYAIDKSKNNTNGKAWTKYMLKSMEISKKDFETMRSAMRGGKK